jgi:hypothetical protein
VLKGTIVHKSGRPGIGGDRTIAGRRLTISGGRNPSPRSTRTMVPGVGWQTTVIRPGFVSARGRRGRLVQSKVPLQRSTTLHHPRVCAPPPLAALEDAREVLPDNEMFNETQEISSSPGYRKRRCNGVASGARTRHVQHIVAVNEVAEARPATMFKPTSSRGGRRSAGRGPTPRSSSPD